MKKSPTKKEGTNVLISIETHRLLVEHIQSIDGKIGKYADKAILEKLKKDKVNDK